LPKAAHMKSAASSLGRSSCTTSSTSTTHSLQNWLIQNKHQTHLTVRTYRISALCNCSIVRSIPALSVSPTSTPSRNPAVSFMNTENPSTFRCAYTQLQ
jgi:hypothetical protein